MKVNELERRERNLAYDDLRDWIKTLEKAGELKRIKEEVSPELEITEITDRVCKIGKQGARDQRTGNRGKTESERRVCAWRPGAAV